MRYIIQHGRAADRDRAAVLTTFTAEQAEAPAEASAQFLARHPDRFITAVIPADDDARARYGLGALTEEEQAAHRSAQRERAAADRIDWDAMRARLMEYTPEEYAIEAAHAARRASETTPNAEGIHAGDILFSCWGYDQTNIDFYQVEQLRGRHTLILRPIAAKSEQHGRTWDGLTRPVRDAFEGEERYTVRTRDMGDPARPWIRDPRLSGDHPLTLATFGRLYSWSGGA